jgi:hypothetical protein
LSEIKSDGVSEQPNEALNSEIGVKPAMQTHEQVSEVTGSEQT